MIDRLYDPAHPLKCPALGIFLSKTLCCLGHNVVVMELDEWDEEWLTCARCGGRFFPADAIDEDTDVVYV